MREHLYGDNQERLRALLRQVRREAGLRQVDLADRLQVSQSVVSNYERGERRLDILELRAVCRACDLTLEAFAHRLEALLD